MQKVKDPRFSFPAYIAIADSRCKDGLLDPCYHAYKGEKPKGMQSDYFYKGIPIGRIRDAMAADNRSITDGLVEESTLHIPFSDHPVEAVMYRPFRKEGKLPCIMYFHGGAYAGGSIKTTANLCRTLCDLHQAVVINVDYRLAPEHPYPQGSDDCYGCFNWIYEHAEQYGIETAAVYTAGDSAGGNFAVNCCIRERELQLDRIKACILYYPHVSMVETKDYPWGLSRYYIDDKDKIEITKNILGLREVIRASEFYYLQSVVEKTDMLVSPLFYEQPDRLPPMLIITAEFDYLRIQQEYFAQRLNRVMMIQYQGMQHAFMDRIGFYPQAEDAVMETCRFLDAIEQEKMDIL